MSELAIVSLAAAALTVATAFITRLHPVQSLDDSLESRAGRLRSLPAVHRAARIGTLPGEPYMHPSIGAATAVALLGSGAGPALRILAPLALASVGAIAIHHAIKFVYRRPRPAIALARGKTEAAYPSGHTTDATAVLLTSAHLLVREGLVAAEIALPVAAALLLATGVSRVLLGWHWSTDVAGGWMAGVAVAAASVSVYEGWPIG